MAIPSGQAAVVTWFLGNKVWYLLFYTTDDRKEEGACCKQKRWLWFKLKRTNGCVWGGTMQETYS